MKLLIIEDNISLANDMQTFLEGAGYIVECALTYNEAKKKILVYNYTLVIVDLGLPDGNGLNIIKEMKDASINSAILILTANDAIDEKVKGLNMGADDYMTKPFHKAELNARINSIIRRQFPGRSNIIKVKEIKIDLLSAQVFINDVLLKLTKKEFDLLVYFMQNQNRLLTKESIAEHLWGDHIDQSDSFDFIYNHIKNLRKKIVAAGGNNYIQAMYGMGYMFTVNNR